MRTFSAMVLGAGFGTRLRPLSDEIPKPLLPVGDRSVLRTLVAELMSQGAGRIVVNAHYHACQILSEVERHSLPVEVSVEDTILGTAGGVRRARALFSPGPVVVQNGDIVGACLAARLNEAEDDADLVLGVTTHRRGEGTVGLGRNGEVVRLRGEIFGQEWLGADYLGTARLTERALEELPEEGCLIGDYALPQLRQGRRVGAVVSDERFVDIGDVASYLEANLRWLEQHLASPWLFLGPASHVEPSVEAAQSIVGEGAEVSGAGALSRVIVLPGAKAQAPLHSAIVTPRGRVIQVAEEGLRFGA
jgi:mannose-1-phosphate guanylyltransferase